jgi:predicted GNAT family N-acyltransferase
MLIFKWNKGHTSFDDAHFIRESVFVKEQGFDSEFDEIDEIAYHLTIYFEDDNVIAEKAVAVARIFTENETEEYHIGRVAVLKEYRGFHYGEALMKEAMRKAAELGAKTAVLGAQKRVEPFYAKLGFEAFGEEYLDQFCPHVNMRVKL